MTLEQICERASVVAREAGAFIRNEARNFDSSKIEYKGLNDMVSYVDKEAERIIVSHLQKILPEAAIIAEEETANNVSGKGPDPMGLHWVVDPLDGTTNFMHSIPAYAVSIALMDKGEVLVGVVYEVSRDECFTAWKGGGAYCNRNPISVSGVEKLKDSLIVTGFPYQDFGLQNDYLSLLAEFMKSSHGVRRFGSAATDLAWIACGRGEGFFEYNLKPWDVAAGALLVQEAGGTVTDFKGGNNYIFGAELLAAGKVHTEMLEVIGKKWN
jgi:myo-inositol-1(or 4)-monophosphatase